MSKLGLKPINDIVKEFEKQIQEYEKENKALKQENDFLHLMATEGARKGIEKSKQIDKLKEQNEELKQEVSEWETEYCRVESLAESLEEEIKILKSYNHQLFEGEGV